MNVKPLLTLSVIFVVVSCSSNDVVLDSRNNKVPSPYLRNQPTDRTSNVPGQVRPVTPIAPKPVTSIPPVVDSVTPPDSTTQLPDIPNDINPTIELPPTNIDDVKETVVTPPKKITVPDPVATPEKNISKHTGRLYDYIVQKNDSYWRISKKYNVSFNQLLKINNVSKNNAKLQVGDVVKLPVNPKQDISKIHNPTVKPSKEPKTQNQNKEKIPADGKYIVKKGDVLSKIAARYGLKTKELQELNKLSSPDKISIGQVILLGKPSSNIKPSDIKPKPPKEKIEDPKPSTIDPSISTDKEVEEVDILADDTFASIMNRHVHMKEADIKSLNNISSEEDFNKLKENNSKLKIYKDNSSLDDF